MRFAIACAEDLIGDANALGSVLGQSEADAATYGLPLWQDSNGNKYCCISLNVGQSFLDNIGSALVAPAWGADMAAARNAQSRLIVWLGEGPPPSPAPGRIVAWVTNDDPITKIVEAGLSPIDNLE